MAEVTSNKNKTMIDNHVHVGWYTDGYHSPKEVWQAELDAGIDEIAVSSTSTCAELYKLIVREMRELIHIGGSCVHPILWLTPKMMKTWGLSYMLHSKIRWQGVKMHWEAHREWFYNRKLLHNALEVARWLEVPVLFHTGDFKECKAGVFMDLCKQYDDLTFVLAHGRPLDETKIVMKECPNVYVDTAFMPADHVKELADAGLPDRILFGTDVPINHIYYNEISIPNYINNVIFQLRETLSLQQYKKIVNNKLYT